MPADLQTADYVLCGLALAMAVTGLFRGFSGTLAFAIASAAAYAAGMASWSYSACLTDVAWQRGACVLVVSLVAFGLMRFIVKKTVNGLLAQPADALFGALVGALLGVAVLVVWAWSGVFPEHSALVRMVAEYVR